MRGRPGRAAPRGAPPSPDPAPRELQQAAARAGPPPRADTLALGERRTRPGRPGPREAGPRARRALSGTPRPAERRRPTPRCPKPPPLPPLLRASSGRAAQGERQTAPRAGGGAGPDGGVAWAGPRAGGRGGDASPGWAGPRAGAGPEGPGDGAAGLGLDRNGRRRGRGGAERSPLPSGGARGRRALRDRGLPKPSLGPSLGECVSEVLARLQSPVGCGARAAVRGQGWGWEKEGGSAGLEDAREKRGLVG